MIVTEMKALLLARLLAVSVYLHLLEVCKVQLNRCSIVTVWGTDHEVAADEFERLTCRLTSVVAGAVEEEHRVLSPLRIFSGELSGEAAEERSHHFAVGVDLGQGGVHMALRVNRRYHVHLGKEILAGERILGASRRPLAVAEVQEGDRRLVDVDDPLATGQQRQHDLGVLLPPHQRRVGVGQVGVALDAAV